VCSEPNVPNRPLTVEPSRLMLPSLSSSGTPSSGPSKSDTLGRRLGDDCAVREGPSSASRTWRMISASRRNSLSTGADSSKSSALMRPNCLDFGWQSQQNTNLSWIISLLVGFPFAPQVAVPHQVYEAILKPRLRCHCPKICVDRWQIVTNSHVLTLPCEKPPHAQNGSHPS
jgi:hypothetical protein